MCIFTFFQLLVPIPFIDLHVTNIISINVLFLIYPSSYLNILFILICWKFSLADFIMDPTIWSKFPNDVLEIVLLFLPFFMLVQLRILNKQSNKILKSKSFVSKLRSSKEYAFRFMVCSWNPIEECQCHLS